MVSGVEESYGESYAGNAGYSQEVGELADKLREGSAAGIYEILRAQLNRKFGICTHLGCSPVSERYCSCRWSDWLGGFSVRVTAQI